MVASGRSLLAHSWGLQPTEQASSRDLTSALHPTTTSSQCWWPHGSAEDFFIVQPELIPLLSTLLEMCLESVKVRVIQCPMRDDFTVAWSRQIEGVKVEDRDVQGSNHTGS